MEKMSKGITLQRIDHLQSLLQVFERLLKNSSLVDCTIATEGQFLKAHRVILSACSPYLELLFSQENEKNPTVVLTNKKFEDLQAVIDFVYQGKVQIPENRLASFVHMAESFQLKEIQNDTMERIVKMSSEEITFQRIDYPKSLTQMFGRLLESSSLADCTIVAEGQYLRAHRVILSACSPYFELLFSHENEKNPIVVLADIKFEDLRTVIDFMYRGEVQIPESRLSNFVHTAESLQIEGMGIDRMKTNVETKENVLSSVNRNENCASSGFHKHMRTSSLNTNARETVSEHSRAVIENVKYFAGCDANFYNQVCATGKKTSNQFCHGGGVALSQCSTVCDGLSKETYTVNVSDQTVTADVNISNRLFTKVSNLPIVEHDVSNESDSANRITHVPENTLQSLKSDFSSFNTNNSSLVAPLLPMQNCDNQAQPSPSCVQPETSEENLHTGEQCVVKTEPEPLAEIFLPESEYLVDPKDEVVVEAAPMFENDDENETEQFSANVGNQEQANQYSSFSPPNEAANMAPSNPFLMPRVVGYTSGQGVNSAGWQQSIVEKQVPPSAVENMQVRPFACTECHKSFSDRKGLYVHLQTHTGERPYTCAECNKSFSRRHNLVVHQRTHTGQRPYTCNDCHKSFSQRAVLIVHQRTHTGERPYSCDECHKSFSQRTVLIVHQRTHTGERPYACGVCLKSFRERHHLISHQRTHTGERPYICSVCRKSFFTSRDLKKHQRIHTIMP